MHKKKELLVIEYLETKSTKTKEDVVISYTPLVEYIARKLAFKREDFPDLVQVGTIGLLKSLDNFKPELKTAFSTFASANIIGEIKHYLRDKSRIVKLPRKLQEHHSKIKQYIRSFSQEHGKSPTISEISKGTEIPEEDILESLEAGQSTQVVSLDKPMYSQGGRSQSQEYFSLLDSLGIEFKDESYLNKEVLKQAIQTLPERSKKIIYLRFYEGLTQKEIAARFNLSQMHVSRIINDSIKQLKKNLTLPPQDSKKKGAN